MIIIYKIIYFLFYKRLMAALRNVVYIPLFIGIYGMTTLFIDQAT